MLFSAVALEVMLLVETRASATLTRTREWPGWGVGLPATNVNVIATHEQQ